MTMNLNWENLKWEQQTTLKEIFENPPRSTITWERLIALLRELGEVSAYEDRVFFVSRHHQQSVCGILHRRRGQNYASAYTVRDIQDLLMQLGIEL